MIKNAQLSPEELDQLRKFESSVAYWSIELGKLTVQRVKIEQTLTGIHDARTKLVESTIKTAGINIDQIVDVKVDIQSGQIMIPVKDTETEEASAS